MLIVFVHSYMSNISLRCVYVFNNTERLSKPYFYISINMNIILVFVVVLDWLECDSLIISYTLSEQFSQSSSMLFYLFEWISWTKHLSSWNHWIIDEYQKYCQKWLFPFGAYDKTQILQLAKVYHYELLHNFAIN